MPAPSSSPPAIGIVADDLTGANDSLVQFAGAGWTSRLVLDTFPPGAVQPGNTLATVTDARPLDDGAARVATARAVVHLIEAGADHLYVKIDSTMRGSIAAQIEGALQVWRQRIPGAFAVVCPAYPAMGRTVEDARLRVNGEPVESTAAGYDPVTPVRTSELRQLLPGSVGIGLSNSVRINTSTTAEYARQLSEAAGSGSGTVVVDASTDADLEQLSAALSLLGPQAVPVGSAGLAGAMAAAWARSAGIPAPTGRLRTPKGRVFVLVSSLHDVSRTQADRLTAAFPTEELHVLRPSLENVMDPSAATAWMTRNIPAWSSLPPVVMILSPADRSAEKAGPAPITGARIADALAAITKTVLENSDVATLILIGGDGARAVLKTVSANSIVVTGSIQEGVPVGVIDGGRAAGLGVITKAGGFGQPDSLLDIVHSMIHSSPLSTEAP